MSAEGEGEGEGLEGLHPVRNDDPPQRRRALRPSHGVDVTSDVARSPLALGAVRRLALHVLRAERIPQAQLSIAFVSPARIARLHRRWVGVAGPTDIVTLEHARAVAGAPVVGEVYIAPEVARANARALGIAPRDEVARLVVHGVLHALGWDHPTDQRRVASPMWRRQEALLRRAQRTGVLSR